MVCFQPSRESFMKDRTNKFQFVTWTENTEKKRKQRKTLFSSPHITGKQNRMQYLLLVPLQCQHWWAQASMSWIPFSSRPSKRRPTAPVRWASSQTSSVPYPPTCSVAGSRLPISYESGLCNWWQRDVRSMSGASRLVSLWSGHLWGLCNSEEESENKQLCGEGNRGQNFGKRFWTFPNWCAQLIPACFRKARAYSLDWIAMLCSGSKI